jgi:mono/diheme cytochrome c family protein
MTLRRRVQISLNEFSLSCQTGGSQRLVAGCSAVSGEMVQDLFQQTPVVTSMNQASVAVALIVCFACVPFVQAQEASKPPERSSAETVTEFERSIEPVLKTYCAACHGDGEREGGLSLEELDARVAGGRDFELWRMVQERVKFGEMPPPEEGKRPRKALLTRGLV